MKFNDLELMQEWINWRDSHTISENYSHWDCFKRGFDLGSDIALTQTAVELMKEIEELEIQENETNEAWRLCRKERDELRAQLFEAYKFVNSTMKPGP